MSNGKVNEDQSERPPTKESSNHRTVVERSSGHIPWVVHQMSWANGMTKTATVHALKSMKPRPPNWIGRWARSQGGF